MICLVIGEFIGYYTIYFKKVEIETEKEKEIEIGKEVEIEEEEVS